ncbi:MAG: phosphodiesterase [Burkholderiaceae bacterium]|nr:phosphodiesterase [Burkholderiaceae bacterium]MBP6814982.1 phosphodiesterase [Burkholderiaceae bacterium]
MRWTKWIHLTDTHLVPPGQLLYGSDPQARVHAAVSSIAAEHPDAQFCLVTGDLAHLGEPSAYVALQRALAELPMPVHLLIGNHDDRVAFRETFLGAPVDDSGYVQQVMRFGSGLMLMLDTNEPGVAHGVYCARRLKWLAAQLQFSRDEPLWIAMHHPPFDVGLPSMDAIGLRDAQAFAEVLAPHRHRVRHLFFGHVHRPISGSWQGIPFSTVRATNHQVALDLHLAHEIPGSFEPPAYAVVLVDPHQTLVHNHDFLDDSRRFAL